MPLVSFFSLHWHRKWLLTVLYTDFTLSAPDCLAAHNAARSNPNRHQMGRVCSK
jgi:hypothetical protein